MALELKLEEKKWYVALALGLGIGAALIFAVYYLFIRGIDQDIVAGAPIGVTGIAA